MNYKVEIPLRVHEQMLRIASYIQEELMAPQAAKNVLANLEGAILSLDLFPERVPLSRDENMRSRGIRCMAVQNFLIYFWIDEENMQVNIINVIYGRRSDEIKLAGVWQDIQ
ncbi:MAG: type II toxin-antitoxin system RelE/ParE family toxin [Selenomonadaceae bacterium]|nr:type II toxin-antitoxin system RelE/ParE family toxin [Selenomonadaceae bacterium]